MTARIAYLEAVVGADITNFRREMRNVRSELGGVTSAFASIQRAGRIMTFALTAPLVGLGGVLVSSASDFEASMRNINSIAGLTEAQFQSLSDRTLEFGSSIRSGPLGAAEALYTVFSAGITDMEQAFSIAEISAYTAEAGLSDLETTTNALAASLLSYGDTSEEAALRASNSLTRMVQVGVGTMEEFASAVGYVLPAAAAAGFGIEDLYGHMAFLTQRGFSASRAATSLNAAISSLISPTSAMEGAFASLGVNGIEGLVEEYGTLDQAILAVAGTTDGSMASLRELFSTERSARAVFAMINNVDALSAALGEFNTDLDSATMDAWEQQMMSNAAQTDLMKSAFQGLGIVIGTHIIPMVAPLITGLRDFALHLSNTNPAVLDLAVGFGAIAAAVGPMLWILGGLANPIVLFTAALAGLGAWASGNGDRIRGVLDDIFGSFHVSMFVGAINQFLDAFGILNDVEMGFNIDSRGWDDEILVPRTIQERLQAGFDNVTINLRSTFSHMWNNARNWFSNTLIPEADTLFGGWISTVADLFSGSSGEGGDTPAFGFLSNILQAVKDFSFEETFPSINAALNSLLGNMGNWLLTEGVPTFSRGLGLFVGEIGQSLAGLINNIFSGGDSNEINLDAMGFVMSGDFTPTETDSIDMNSVFIEPFLSGLTTAFEDAEFDSWAEGAWTTVIGALGAVATVAFFGSLLTGAGIMGSFGTALGVVFTAGKWVVGLGAMAMKPVFASMTAAIGGSSFAASVGAWAIGFASMLGVVLAGVGLGVLIAGALEEAGVGEDIRNGIDDILGEGTMENLNRNFENFVYHITGNEDMINWDTPENNVGDMDQNGVDDNLMSPMATNTNSQQAAMTLASNQVQVTMDQAAFEEQLNSFGMVDLEAQVALNEQQVYDELMMVDDAVTEYPYSGIDLTVQADTSQAEQSIVNMSNLVPQSMTVSIGISVAINDIIGNIMGTVDSILDSLPGFASGGRPTGLSIVGEEGPELFVPDSMGTIIPNDALGASNGSGGGSVTYNNEITINGATNVDNILYELRRRGIRLS